MKKYYVFPLIYIIISTLHDQLAQHLVKSRYTMQLRPFMKLAIVTAAFLVYTKQLPKLQKINKHLIMSTIFYYISDNIKYAIFAKQSITPLQFALSNNSKLFWCVIFSQKGGVRDILVASLTFISFVIINNYTMRVLIMIQTIFSALGSYHSAKYVLFGSKYDFTKRVHRIFTFTSMSVVWSVVSTLSVLMVYGIRQIDFTLDSTLVFCFLSALNSIMSAITLSTCGPVMREGLKNIKNSTLSMFETGHAYLMILMVMISCFFAWPNVHRTIDKASETTQDIDIENVPDAVVPSA